MKPLKPHSQCERLRKHFDAGRSITVFQALRMGICALSQRCGDLRRDGYPVDGRMVKTRGGARVKRYRKETH